MAVSLLLSGCGADHPSGPAPRITSLNPTRGGAANRPIDIHGTVIDSTTGLAIQLAHVTYDGRVTKSDAAGAFAFSSVTPNQPLYVVAAGFGRYNAPWNPAQPQIKLAPFEVRGIYMPFDGLTNKAITDAIERHTSNTEINTVVLEIKTDDGQIPPEMATPAAEAANAVVQGADVKGFVQRMHERGLYMVGRFVVFRDPTLAAAHGDWALRRIGDGRVYEDEQGQKWIDAFRREVWQYNLDIAEKAAQIGIDEIQFDYVRFPGASRLEYAEPMTEQNRVAAIGGFFKLAEERLRKYGVVLSADTFGLTTVATDDTGIGQDIETLGQYIDYYCPMVYPSTWSDGSLGVAYPPADPYSIVLLSVQSAAKRLANIPSVRVRPWLQAFDDYKSRRIEYTPDRVNIQKMAGAKAGGTGWMLWHPGSRYDAAAIGPRQVAANVTVSH